jgi:hypothetical protein
MKKFLLPLLAWVYMHATFAQITLEEKAQVVATLAHMIAEDQQFRQRIDYAHISESVMAEKESISRKHVATLKELLQTHYWMSILEFGKIADQQAWLIVQHADHDRAFQKEMLSRLEQLAQQGKTDPCHVAYLHDRVAVNEGRPQRYGTQGDCNGNEWVLYPVEEPDKLNMYRITAGLPPLQVQMEQVENLCKVVAKE